MRVNCRNQAIILKTPGQRVNERYGDFSPVIPLPSFGVRVDFRHGFNSQFTEKRLRIPLNL